MRSGHTALGITRTLFFMLLLFPLAGCGVGIALGGFDLTPRLDEKEKIPDALTPEFTACEAVTEKDV